MQEDRPRPEPHVQIHVDCGDVGNASENQKQGKPNSTIPQVQVKTAFVCVLDDLFYHFAYMAFPRLLRRMGNAQ